MINCSANKQKQKCVIIEAEKNSSEVQQKVVKNKAENVEKRKEVHGVGSLRFLRLGIRGRTGKLYSDKKGGYYQCLEELEMTRISSRTIWGRRVEFT